MESFEVWCLMNNSLHPKTKCANFYLSSDMKAILRLKNLAFPKGPIEMTYKHAKEQFLQHLKPVNFELAERAAIQCLM